MLRVLRCVRVSILLTEDRFIRLVSNDVLDLVSQNAMLLYVGKTAGYHGRTQDEIHELLLSFVEAGATVVRLKGGRSTGIWVGRSGEEMDFLQQQGIQVKVIPGQMWDERAFRTCLQCCWVCGSTGLGR